MNWLVAFVTASHADVPKVIKKKKKEQRAFSFQLGSRGGAFWTPIYST